ncbi:MAG: histidinol-phosphate transaminase [Armatimonadetes bacterium]|nr:histidinol-phosphate transaminase [Armatimonadota bacterium]
MARIDTPTRVETLKEATRVAENITRLTPYRPGKPVAEVERELGITGIIKLASNENSLGPSPKAVAAIHNYASKMHVYPDASSFELRNSLSAHLNVASDTIVLGNGSDDIIHLLGVTFLEPGDEVIQGYPSFVRYESAAILNNAPCHLVPLTSDWVHDLDAMAERLNSHTRMVFITNPNNPTGTIVSQEALERFIAKVPERALIIIDEAYYEYAAPSPDYSDALRYVREGENVVVLRTFSKIYGLAGLRVGYGVMRSDIADSLHQTREPFNLNLMAQLSAVAALADQEHVTKTVEMNEAGKADFYRAFEEMGLDYTPTYGNFVWFDTRKNSAAVFQALLREGVITRTGDVFGAPTYLRVTVGTQSENTKFLNALRKTLSSS